MRRLYLVGMAPPEDKETGGNPHPCGLLTDLVALDPRHGVFPNLVMTPLLATLHSLRRERPEQVDSFWLQVEALLLDQAENRFNILLKPAGDRLEMSPDACDRVKQFDTVGSLWAVFGYWTVASLVNHLLTGDTAFTRRVVNKGFRKFMRHVCSVTAREGGVAQPLPKQKTAVVGMLHRLCTSEPATAPTTLAILHRAVAASGVAAPQAERVVAILRAIVPLPHNEAYQNVPFGKIQNCFMTGHDPDPTVRANPPAEVFWRYMGQSLCQRLLACEEEAGPVAALVGALGNENRAPGGIN